MDVRFYPAPPASVGSCSLPTDPSCLSSLDYYHSNKVNDESNKQTKKHRTKPTAQQPCSASPASRNMRHNLATKTHRGRSFAHSAYTLYRTNPMKKKSKVSASKRRLICGCTGLNVVIFVITPLWNLQPLCFFFFFPFLIFFLLKENTELNFSLPLQRASLSFLCSPTKVLIMLFPWCAVVFLHRAGIKCPSPCGRAV